LGVLVEPADREDALRVLDDLEQIAGDVRLDGRGDADRLVERDVDVPLLAADRLAVDTNDVAARDLRAQRGHDAVDRDASSFDARVCLTARAQAGLADVLVQSQTLRRRNELIVTLMFPLELQEIVIPADLAVGIAPADVGPCVVDGAAAFVPVEEAAHGLVDVVLMVAQDLLVARSIAVREPLLRLGLSHAEVPRQALDVELAHGDAIVTAAIARALETVVARHDPILCKVTKLKAY